MEGPAFHDTMLDTMETTDKMQTQFLPLVADSNQQDIRQVPPGLPKNIIEGTEEDITLNGGTGEGFRAEGRVMCTLKDKWDFKAVQSRFGKREQSWGGDNI